MTVTTTYKFVSDHTRPSSPGWPEILAGGVAYGASFVLVAVFLPLVRDEGMAGVIGLVVSGLMGLIAFAVAVLVRIRRTSVFGIRKAKVRHLLAGVALGLVAFVLGGLASFAFVLISGDQQENTQASYQTAATAGMVSLVITLVAGAVITPIGEEAFFRGVVANGLLARCGAWIGIIGSAAVFAIAHGFNPIFPAAFVVGIFTALLFRWSGSIWPGVVLHSVNNALAFLLPVVVATLMG